MDMFYYYAVARAAIAAMREPTDGMIETRIDKMTWQDMIDAALEGK